MADLTSWMCRSGPCFFIIFRRQTNFPWNSLHGVIQTYKFMLERCSPCISFCKLFVARSHVIGMILHWTGSSTLEICKEKYSSGILFNICCLYQLSPTVGYHISCDWDWFFIELIDTVVKINRYVVESSRLTKMRWKMKFWHFIQHVAFVSIFTSPRWPDLI